MNVIVKENKDATSKRYVQGLGAVLHRTGAPEQAESESWMPECICRKPQACSDSMVVAGHGGVG